MTFLSIFYFLSSCAIDHDLLQSDSLAVSCWVYFCTNVSNPQGFTACVLFPLIGRPAGYIYIWALISFVLLTGSSFWSRLVYHKGHLLFLLRKPMSLLSSQLVIGENCAVSRTFSHLSMSRILVMIYLVFNTTLKVCYPIGNCFLDQVFWQPPWIMHWINQRPYFQFAFKAKTFRVLVKIIYVFSVCIYYFLCYEHKSGWSWLFLVGLDEITLLTHWKCKCRHKVNLHHKHEASPT